MCHLVVSIRHSVVNRNSWNPTFMESISNASVMPKGQTNWRSNRHIETHCRHANNHHFPNTQTHQHNRENSKAALRLWWQNCHASNTLDPFSNMPFLISIAFRIGVTALTLTTATTSVSCDVSNKLDPSPTCHSSSRSPFELESPHWHWQQQQLHCLLSNKLDRFEDVSVEKAGLQLVSDLTQCAKTCKTNLAADVHGTWATDTKKHLTCFNLNSCQSGWFHARAHLAIPFCSLHWTCLASLIQQILKCDCFDKGLCSTTSSNFHDGLDLHKHLVE